MTRRLRLRTLPAGLLLEPVKAARGARSSEDSRKTAARAREATPPYRRRACVADLPALEFGLVV